MRYGTIRRDKTQNNYYTSNDIHFVHTGVTNALLLMGLPCGQDFIVLSPKKKHINIKSL